MTLFQEFVERGYLWRNISWRTPGRLSSHNYPDCVNVNCLCLLAAATLSVEILRRCTSKFSFPTCLDVLVAVLIRSELWRGRRDSLTAHHLRILSQRYIFTRDKICNRVGSVSSPTFLNQRFIQNSCSHYQACHHSLFDFSVFSCIFAHLLPFELDYIILSSA